MNRSANFYLAILISTIFLIAFIAAISSGNSLKTLNKGTPEATVQSYLQAVTDGRNDEAASYFATSSKCTADDIDRAYIDENLQVLLEKTSFGSGNTAIVYISVQRSDGPLMTDLYQENQSFRLIKESGIWKMAGIPWPLYDCGGFFK